MQLFFIRHGQSENNALWARDGSAEKRVPDPHITETGRRQLQETARFLDFCLTSDLSAGVDPSCGLETGHVVLFCSLMTRAVESATILSERLNLPIYAQLDIHENGGIYRDDMQTGGRIGESGLSKKDFEQRYPHVQLPSGMNHDGWWNRPFEEREVRRDRAAAVLTRLIENHAATTDTLIMVSHAGFYNYFLREVLGMPNDTKVWFELFNGAVTLLNFDREDVSIFYHNRYDFMPLDIVT